MSRRVVVLAGATDGQRSVAGAVQAELVASGVPVSLVHQRRRALTSGNEPRTDADRPRRGRDGASLVLDAVRALRTYDRTPVDVVLVCDPRDGLACVERLQGLKSNVVLVTEDRGAGAVLENADLGDVEVDVLQHAAAAPPAVAAAIMTSLGLSGLPDHPGWLA